MTCQIRKRWSNSPNTEVFAVALVLAMPPKFKLGINPLILASGKSRGVLMLAAARVALLSEGAMVTPPRATPKMNSLMTEGPKL